MIHELRMNVTPDTLQVLPPPHTTNFHVAESRHHL